MSVVNFEGVIVTAICVSAIVGTVGAYCGLAIRERRDPEALRFIAVIILISTLLIASNLTRGKYGDAVTIVVCLGMFLFPGLLAIILNRMLSPRGSSRFVIVLLASGIPHFVALIWALSVAKTS
jgi:hypothetical protein